MENIIPTPTPVKAKTTAAKTRIFALVVGAIAGLLIAVFFTVNLYVAAASSTVIDQKRVGNECHAYQWAVPHDYHADLDAYRADHPDARPTREIPCRPELERYL